MWGIGLGCLRRRGGASCRHPCWRAQPPQCLPHPSRLYFTNSYLQFLSLPRTQSWLLPRPRIIITKVPNHSHWRFPPSTTWINLLVCDACTLKMAQKVWKIRVRSSHQYLGHWNRDECEPMETFIRVMQEPSRQAPSMRSWRQSLKCGWRGVVTTQFSLTYYYKLETTLSQIAVKQICWHLMWSTKNRKVTLFL